jgi:FtsH-binding integral membrane protein
MGMTAAITVGISIYACRTTTDLTMCGGFMVAACIAMLFLSLSMMFMTFVEWWHPVVSAGMVVFYGLFLIYDTQLICRDGQHNLAVDDYILGSMIIYVDVIGIFIHLL